MDHHDMHISRWNLLLALAAASLQLLITGAPANAADVQLTRAQKEQFLLTAEVVKTRRAPKGITGTIRATLSDGTLTHDASIQTVDEYKPKWEGQDGRFEMNFRDTWKFNIAAYKLDQLLGLNMVPATVERRYNGAPASFTWWVDDYAMDEVERLQKKIPVPDAEAWNAQMFFVRVFDQLIFNVDRNMQNLVTDKNWQIWMIDHSRAFRTIPNLRDPKNLVRCDQDLLERLRLLNDDGLKTELGKYLNSSEIKGLLARRDRIVNIFDEKGPSTLYRAPRRPE